MSQSLPSFPLHVIVATHHPSSFHPVGPSGCRQVLPALLSLFAASRQAQYPAASSGRLFIHVSRSMLKQRARHGGITVYIAIRGCRYVPTCEQQAANKRRDAESLQFPVDLRSGLALSRPFQLSRKTTCLCPSKSQIVAPGLVTVGGGRPSEPTQLHPIAVARDQCLTTTIARRTGGLLPTSPSRPAPSWTRSPQVARPRHGAFYTIHPKIAHQLERVIRLLVARVPGITRAVIPYRQSNTDLPTTAPKSKALWLRRPTATAPSSAAIIFWHPPPCRGPAVCFVLVVLGQRGRLVVLGHFVLARTHTGSSKTE